MIKVKCVLLISQRHTFHPVPLYDHPVEAQAILRQAHRLTPNYLEHYKVKGNLGVNRCACLKNGLCLDRGGREICASGKLVIHISP